MRVSAVQQFTPGECTLFRLAHKLEYEYNSKPLRLRNSDTFTSQYPIAVDENTRASSFSQLWHQR